MRKKISLWSQISIDQFKRIYKSSKETISQNLWLELLFMVGLALSTAGIVFLIVSHFVYSMGLGKYT